MFCCNFLHLNDDSWSPRSSLRRSREKEKNPYTNRGLDKFTTLLVDLEARREKILAEVGAQDSFLVRFVQSNLVDWVPIVVKLKDPKQAKSDPVHDKNRPIRHASVAIKETPIGSSAQREFVPAAVVSDGRTTMKRRFSWGMNNNGLLMISRRPSFYWSAVLILILLCLVMFGRCFAILCTSIWWYLVPTIRDGNGNMRRSVKGYGRRLSGKK